MFDSNEAKLELYKYVKDIYDKLIAARQGQKARLSIFLILTGLLSTAIFTFAMPSVLVSLEFASSLPPESRISAAIIAAIPFIALVPLAIFLFFNLWSIVEGLEFVKLGLADMTRDQARAAMETDHLDPVHTLNSLMGNYLAAIDRNQVDNEDIGRCIHSVIGWTKLAIVAAFLLLVLVPISRFQLQYWCAFD